MSEGATVYCADVNRAAAEYTAGLTADEGGSALVLEGDVSEADIGQRLVVDGGLAWG